MKTLVYLSFILALASACSKKVDAPSAAPAPVAVVSVSGDQLCTGSLKKFVTFKDPDSVRVNSVEPNDKVPGRFYLSVSAKNSYGGYGDAVTCTCGTANGAVTDMHCDGVSG